MVSASRALGKKGRSAAGGQYSANVRALANGVQVSLLTFSLLILSVIEKGT